MGLTALLFGLFFSALLPVMRSSVRGNAQIELQSLLVTALGRLEADLRQSVPGAVSVAPGVVGIQSLVGVDDQARQQYSTNVSVYYQADSRLMHKVWPPGPPVGSGLSTRGPELVPAPQLQAIVGQTNGRERTLSPYVKSFAVTAGNPLTVSLQLEMEVTGGRGAVSANLTRAVLLRGSATQ